MLQTHSIASAVTVIYPLPIWVLGIGVALLTALVVLGGVKRITETASLVVPFMAVIYLLGVIYIVITHFAQIPALFAQIMSSAFTTEAAAGGAVGYTIKEAVRNGVARGLFPTMREMAAPLPCMRLRKSNILPCRALPPCSGPL